MFIKADKLVAVYYFYFGGIFMKTKILRNSRRSLSIFLAFVLVLTTLFAGSIISANAGGRKWRGNYFFRAPDGWDLSKYSHVQAWAVQSESASSGIEYAFLLGNMSIVGTTSDSRLYFLNIPSEINHTTWKPEYIAFTANTSDWGTGKFFISTCGQYTEPLDYGGAISSGSYLFSPLDSSNNTASNNNKMVGDYNGTERDVIKFAQDFYVYTDGSASTTGGTISATCYYTSGSDYSGSSAITSSTINVNSSDTDAHEQYEQAVEGTKATLSATASDNYNFDGWYDGTDTSTAKCLSTNTTYTYYVHRTKSVYAHFSYNEPKYTITIQSGGHGSVSPASVEAGAVIAASLGTATPDYGYKFVNWTYSGGGISITNPNSATGATATATSSGGTVTANFAPADNMNLYIAGRIHVKDSNGDWVNSYDSNHWSDTGDENIKFEYDSTAQKYKVNTRASIKDLATEHDNNDPWFFVYDSDKTYYWYYENSTALGLQYSNRGTEYELTKYTSNSSTYDCKLKFSGSTDETPVTIWFDAKTHKFSFTVPNFYDIAFTNNPTGGTVTVTANSTESSTSPVRLEENTSYTAKFKPNTGYDIDTVTVGGTPIAKSSLGGNASSGYIYTSTATADKTIVATFKKIDYTITYPTPSDYTLGGSMPSTANYQDNVSFTVTPSANFRIDSVTCTKAGGGTVTLTKNGTTYSFTMPADNVTITVTSIAQKTLTVTKTDGSEGISKVEYKIGSASSYTTYSSPVVVDNGSTVALKVTYVTGWEYKAHSFTGSSGTKTSDTQFSISSMTTNTTFNIDAKKTLYTISVANSTGLGTYTIKDANNNTITQTTIGEQFYVTVTSAANYAVNSFSHTGTGTTAGTPTKTYDDTAGTSTATIEYTMGSANVTVTPSFVTTRCITLPSLPNDHVVTTIHYLKMDGSAEATLTEGNSIWARTSTSPSIYVNPDSGYNMDIEIKDGTTSLTTLDNVTHKDSAITNYTYSTFGNSTTTATINIVATEDLTTDYAILGDFNDWTGNQYKFTKRSGASDSNLSYVTITFSSADAITYSTTASGFKLKKNDETWYTNSGLEFVTDGVGILDDTTSGSASNAKLYTTVAGDYTFALDTSNSHRTLTVTYPDQNITYTNDSNVAYHSDTQYHPTTAKYSNVVTVKVRANSNYKIESMTVANQTGNYNSYKPTSVSFTRPTVNYSDAANTVYYYTFTFTMGKDHVNITFTTSQISLAVIPNLSTTGFSTKIYNDAQTQEITTIQTGQFYKIVAVAKDDTYTITSDSFTDTNKPANNLSSSGNIYTFRCRANAYDLDAGINYIASTPVISVNGAASPSNAEINMVAGKSNDLSSVITVAKKANNANSWIKLAIYDTSAHAQNGPDNSTGKQGSTSTNPSAVTAPSTKGTYYMCAYAYNLPADLSTGAYSLKIIIKVNVNYARTTTNFYVDVHSFTINSGSTNQVEIYNHAKTAVYQDDNDQALIKSLTKVDNSTIYQATGMNIPDNNVDLYAKVTVNSVVTWVELSATKISNAPNQTLDVWLEATAPTRYTTTDVHSTSVTNMPASGTKRIYLCKDSALTAGDWNDIYIYAWQTSPYNENTSWANAPRMYDLGYKPNGTSNDYYYYMDIGENMDMMVLKGNNSKKTDNISLSGGSNFYKIDKDLKVTAQNKVTQPKITSYYSSIDINAGNTINIKPLGVTDGMKVTYTSANTNVATVDSSGVLTAHGGAASATTTITIKVEGSIREKEGFTLYTSGTNVQRDYYEKTVTVNVIDDTLINGVSLMSYESAVSTVSVENLSGVEKPADITGVDTRISVKGKQYKTTSVTSGGTTTYTYCGIVTLDTTNNTATIKYAKPDNTNGYTSSDIICEARVDSEVIDRGVDAERYGFEKWKKNSVDLTPVSTYGDDCYILIDGNSYQKCFKSYKYTDIYVTYQYYDYRTDREDGSKVTFYDSTYVDEDNSRGKFADTHVLHTYTKIYEIRDVTRSQIAAYSTADKNSLMNTAALDKLVNVKSNYYSYAYNVNCIDTSSFQNKSGTNHGMEFVLTLAPTIRRYKVNVNNADSFTNLTYQQMVECNSTNLSGVIDGSTIYKWQSRKTKNDTTHLVTVATGKDYKFRVTDDTYLTASALGGDTNLTTNGNASVVTHSGYEVQQDDTINGLIDILYQNFYIADFYNTAKMAEYTVSVDEIDEYGDLTGNTITETKKHDLNFVGGGILFYSIDNSTGAVNNKMLDNRYVDSANKELYYDSTADTYPIIEKIRELIEAQNSNKEIAYGTPSGYVQGTKEKGETVSSGTGFYYKFLPFMQYNRASGECDIKNNDAFRYSSALGAYQYIFTQGMTNKSSTKNMRVYSYYIYSYNDYENNDGELVYKYVVSENFADAATYVNNSTINN